MKKTKFRVSAVIIIVMLMTFFFSLTLCEVSPLITNIADQTGWSLGQVGELNSIVFFLMGAFALVASPIMDILGTKKTALLALALAAISHLTSTICAEDFTLHYIRQFVYGCSWGMFFLVPGAVLNYWMPEKSRAFFLGMRCAVDLGSCAVAYYIVLPIFHAANDNWQITFLIMGILGAVLFILYWLFVPETEEEQAETAAKKANRHSGHKSKPGIIKALKCKEVYLVMGGLIGMQIVYNAWSSYLPAFLELERGYSAESASSITGFMSLAGIIAGLGGGAVSSAIGRRRVLTWPILLIGLIGAFGSLYANSTGLLTLFSGCVGFGITGYMTAYTTIPGELKEAVNDIDFYNGAVAVIYCVGFIVSYFIPNVIDAVITAGKTLQHALMLCAIPLCVSVVISFFIPETGKKGKYAQALKLSRAESSAAK